MIEKERIGEMLKQLRLARGWRQTDVAEKAGLSRSMISNIESGRRSMTISTLKTFCEIYNVDISYFGMETDSYNEVVDLIGRVNRIFHSDDVSEAKKDELYRIIMKLYLDSKEK